MNFKQVTYFCWTPRFAIHTIYSSAAIIRIIFIYERKFTTFKLIRIFFNDLAWFALQGCFEVMNLSENGIEKLMQELHTFSRFFRLLLWKDLTDFGFLTICIRPVYVFLYRNYLGKNHSSSLTNRCKWKINFYNNYFELILRSYELNRIYTKTTLPV